MEKLMVLEIVGDHAEGKGKQKESNKDKEGSK